MEERRKYKIRKCAYERCQKDFVPNRPMQKWHKPACGVMHYYYANHEQSKKTSREHAKTYQKRHPDRVYAKHKKWIAQHPDYMKKYGKEWFKKHPGYGKDYTNPDIYQELIAVGIIKTYRSHRGK
jgi:hypothetical protein